MRKISQTHTHIHTRTDSNILKLDFHFEKLFFSWTFLKNTHETTHFLLSHQKGIFLFSKIWRRFILNVHNLWISRLDFTVCVWSFYFFTLKKKRRQIYNTVKDTERKWETLYMYIGGELFFLFFFGGSSKQHTHINTCKRKETERMCERRFSSLYYFFKCIFPSNEMKILLNTFFPGTNNNLYCWIKLFDCLKMLTFLDGRAIYPWGGHFASVVPRVRSRSGFLYTALALDHPRRRISFLVERRKIKISK